MKRLLFKIFIYFLCISFFNSVACLENINLEAKEIGFPIGEIVSKGDVQFEAKEMVWRNIESPNFPIFKKGKIKTGNGTGIIHLANNCQIEVAQNSILSFDHVDQLHLSQGKINFRIPPGAEVIFRVETLLVTKSRIQQASKNATMGSAKNEETIGSISLHPSGSVTVKNLQGSLSILAQDRSVLAALSSKDSITIPSAIASGKSRTTVAQAGEIKEVRGELKNAGDKEWEFLGLDAVEWIALGYAAALLGWLLFSFWPEKKKEIPQCP